MSYQGKGPIVQIGGLDGAVGIGVQPDADPTSVLDVLSTAQGFLLPRMTETQRDAIGAPQQGLTIFNTTRNASEYFDGTVWIVVGRRGVGGNPGQVQFNDDGEFQGHPGLITSGGSSALQFLDSIEAQFGVGSDFRIFHDGIDSRIRNETGALQIEQLGAGPLLLNSFSAVNDIVAMVGTSTAVTGFAVHDVSDAKLFTVRGDGAVGLGLTFPAASALMEMESTTRGFLQPRMTTTERDAIASPATGLEIYNLTTNEPEYFNGSVWLNTGGTAAGGNDTELQFNNSGAFAGASGITTDGTNLAVVGNIVVTGLASTNIEFIDDSTQRKGAAPSLKDGRVSATQFNQTFNVGSEDGTQNGLTFRDDGLKLYVVGNANCAIFEYDLSIAWDVSTAVINQSFSVLTENTIPSGVSFKTDGTRMYVVGVAVAQGREVYQYDLGTAWDVSTAVFDQSFSVNSQDSSPFSIVFRPDGGQFIIAGVANDAVFSYDLTTPWDVTTSSFVNSFTPSEPSDVVGMGMRDDGLLMHILSDADDSVFEYLLTTPWDVSTAQFQSSFSTAVDGLVRVRGSYISPYSHKLYLGGQTTNLVYEYDLGILATKVVADEVQALTVQASAVRLAGVQFSDGSTSGFGTIPDSDNGHVSTIESDSDLDLSGVIGPVLSAFIGKGGTKAYISEDIGLTKIKEYDLSTPYDISSAAFLRNFTTDVDDSPFGIFVTPDGINFYVSGESDREIQWWVLSTPWETNSAVLTGTYDFTGDVASMVPGSITVSPCGTFYLVGDRQNNVMRKWGMSVPFDITTSAVISGTFALPSDHRGSTFKPDGSVMYVSSLALALNEYLLTTPWDITSARLIASIAVAGTSTNDVYLSPDCRHLYVCDGGDDFVRGYILGTDTVGKIISAGHEVSALGSTTEEIFSAADLDALATAGVITVAAGETLTLDFKGGTFVTGVRYALEGATSRLRFTSNNANATIVYVGTGDFLSGSANRVSFFNLFVVSVAAGTFCDLQDATLSMTACQLVGWVDLGTMTVGNEFGKGIALFDCVLVDCDVGWDTTNCSIGTVNTTLVLTGMAGPLYTINPNTVSVLIVTLVIGSFSPTGSVFRVDPALSADTRMTIASSNITAGNLFDTTGGIAGTFTAVADASVASTGIDSVSDSGGFARFNFTVGPTMHLGQEVDITGFVTNTAYNVTALITAVGAGFFEIGPLAFGSDEAVGAFTSASVTVTSATHGLSNGETLVLDGDGTSDYDGGGVIYQAATNNFRMNRTFVATAEGTWDTTSLDQKDPRIITSVNPGFSDSKYIAAAFVNDNATANGAIVNDTFTDMVFGTGGGGLIDGSTMERWKLVDPILGIFEYFGNEPFDGLITFDFTVVSSGGTVDFRFKWVIDTGSGFGDLDDNVEALVAVSSDAESVTKTFPLACLKGCQIKPQITRSSGTSGITTSYATIYANQ